MGVSVLRGAEPGVVLLALAGTLLGHALAFLCALFLHFWCIAPPIGRDSTPGPADLLARGIRHVPPSGDPRTPEGEIGSALRLALWSEREPRTVSVTVE